MIKIEKLYKINIMKKYEKYLSMFNSDIENIEIILPEHVIDKYRSDLDLEKDAILEFDKEIDYLKVFEKNQHIFDSLASCKINVLAYNAFLEFEKNETILSSLRSFKPVNGFARKCRYDQNRTITGRLVNTDNSPRILTLPTRCRKILDSRWGSEGVLYSIDFKTLEPRVVRKINKKECSDDVYQEILESLDFDIDRSIIKRGIISILYGSTSQIKGLSRERSTAVLDATKNYFDLESLYYKASKTFRNEYRTNYFGRPLWNLEEENKNKVINNYVQSSAVDIALSYFSSIISEVDIESCIPVFIIHDALVFDIKKSYEKTFLELVKKGYCCSRLGYFPLEATKFVESLNDKK
jgi:hypothetical protein